MVANRTKNSNGTAPPLMAARAYVAAGLCVIPVKDDGSKAPAIKWKSRQSELPRQEDVEDWFANGRYGPAIVGGKISGGLECIDFDREAETIFSVWCTLVEAEVPGLVARLSVALTPGKERGAATQRGRHVRYRCVDVAIPGNQKLAIDCNAPPDDQVLIETRGEGGYALAPGCPAACHDTGRLYEHHSGPKLSAIQTISAAEREILIRAALSFDRSAGPEMQEPEGTEGPEETPPPSANEDRERDGLAPGEDYNRHGPDWTEILTGWTMLREFGNGGRYWRRPGKKDSGWSATTGVCSSEKSGELFAVFSSNAHPFEGASQGRKCGCYSKFAAYTLLNHQGDFKAAAKELASQGYGDQRHQKNGQTGKGNREGGPSHQKDDSQPVLTGLDTVTASAIRWFWKHWIPRDTLTLLDGDPGLGKSTLALDLAARASRGWEMPPSGGPCEGAEPDAVLLLSAEDDLARTIRPRLDAAGADPSRIVALEAIRDGKEDRPPVLPWDLALVENVIKERGIGLIVVDPFMAFLDGEIDAHKDQDIRRCLHRLKLLAERTGAAIVLIRHLNKLGHNVAIYRGGGSIGIVGAVRSALLVGRDPENPSNRVLASSKSNLGPAPRSLTYRLDPAGNVARIGWIGETDLTANDILVHCGGSKRQSASEQAAAAIQEILADSVMESGELDRQLQERGFRPNAIRDGRRLAGVKSFRVGFPPDAKYMVSLGGKAAGE